LLLLLPPLLLSVSCSDETLSLFFDIPPPTAVELAAAEKEKAAAEAKAKAAASPQTADPVTAAAEEAERQVTESIKKIESIKTWEEAEKLLPKDADEGVDWVAAVRKGVIKPRASVDGRVDPETKIFKWDFYFTGPDPEQDAYFPHSAHTEWLTCESCHPKIFRSRGIEVVMDKIFEGEFCGVCHGTVAFPLDSCARCHTAQAE
jgi:c(7)-type cytochrome triheme protein